GLLITLLVDGTAQGSASSGTGGTWLIYPSAMADGFHTLTATATSGAGTSPESAPVTIAVGAASNTQLTVTNESIPDGGFVNSSQPPSSVTLTNGSGTGIDSSTITVLLDGVAVNATVTTVNANTISVAFTPNSFLPQGSH